jgi:hypothetical protein
MLVSGVNPHHRFADEVACTEWSRFPAGDLESVAYRGNAAATGNEAGSKTVTFRGTRHPGVAPPVRV